MKTKIVVTILVGCLSFCTSTSVSGPSDGTIDTTKLIVVPCVDGLGARCYYVPAENLGPGDRGVCALKRFQNPLIECVDVKISANYEGLPSYFYSGVQAAVRGPIPAGTEYCVEVWVYGDDREDVDIRNLLERLPCPPTDARSQ